MVQPNRRLHKRGWNTIQPARTRNAFRHARNILGSKAYDDEIEELGNEIAAEHFPAILRSIRNLLLGGERRLRADMLMDVDELVTFQQFLGRERRVIVVTPHVNNYGDVIRVIGLLFPRNARVTIMWERDPFGRFLKLTNGFLDRNGPVRFDTVASRDLRSLGEIAAKLRAMGGDVAEVMALDGMRGDLVPESQRVRIPFLRGEAWFPLRPALLAEATGAPVVPMSIGEVEGRLKISFGEPVRFPLSLSDEGRSSALRDFTATYAGHLAKGIAESPHKLDINRSDFWV